MKFRLDTPLRRVIVVFTNHFDLTYFQWIMQISAWGKLQVLAYYSIIMLRLTSNSVSMSLRMLYLSCVKMRELHCPAKTEQKLALGGWHSANALALLLNIIVIWFINIMFYINLFTYNLLTRFILMTDVYFTVFQLCTKIWRSPKSQLSMFPGPESLWQVYWNRIWG